MSRVFEVPDISCEHCKLTIESALSGLAGVRRVEVNVSARTVLVEGEAPEPAITASLADAGYEVRGVADLDTA